MREIISVLIMKQSNKAEIWKQGTGKTDYILQLEITKVLMAEHTHSKKLYKNDFLSIVPEMSEYGNTGVAQMSLLLPTAAGGM